MNRQKGLFILIVLFILTASYALIFVLSNETILLLTEEDHFFEWATAIGFLISSIGYFYLFRNVKVDQGFHCFKTQRNVFLLLLGLFFLVCFGEEISWGQRIFNVETPKQLREINMQGEINVHNLPLFHGFDKAGKTKTGWRLFLTGERLYSLFCLFFCVVIPILNKASGIISRQLKKLNMPIVPLWIGVFFIVNFLLSRVIDARVADSLQHAVQEIKECNYAVLFSFICGYFIVKRSIDS